MAEKPNTLGEQVDSYRESREFEVKICDKIVKHVGLPESISGEMLLSSIEEIMSLEDLSTDTPHKAGESAQVPDKTQIDADLQIKEASQKLALKIQMRKKQWQELIQYFGSHPDDTMKDFEEELTRAQGKNGEKNTEKGERDATESLITVSGLILDILEFGAQKEEALQKMHAIQGYHFPKTAAFWSTVLIEFHQEVGEEILGRERINKFLYGNRAAHLYERTMDPLRSSVRIRRAGMEFSKELRTAREIVTQSQPALDIELAKKGLDAAARKDIYGKAVVFLAENPTGQKLASMVDFAATSKIGESARSVASGMKEGFVSPLCACMLACSLGDAPDKEKAVMQYFTYLLAGQLVQEGAKPFGRGLLKILEKMAPRGDARMAKIGKWLMSDVPKSKPMIILASIAVVCAAFKFDMVTNQINSAVEWLDQNIDHGTWREATANSVDIIATVAGLELVLGWNIMKEVTGLNGVNPFKDQQDFLYEHPGKEGLELWNKRVTEVQNGGVADIFTGAPGEVQKSILEEQKLKDPNQWAEQNIIRFQNLLGEFDTVNAGFMAMMQGLPETPGSDKVLLGTNDKLRYREYAIADSDIWITRDHLAPEEWLTPVADMRTGYARSMKTRLDGFNDKAITWLEDLDGSAEDRIDEFFEHTEARIKEETDKCMVRTEVSPGRTQMAGMVSVYVPPQYEYTRDEQKYAQVKPWIDQVRGAKQQWEIMRRTALEIAKITTIGRSLNVYKQRDWEDGTIENGSLLFRGNVERIASNYRLEKLTKPTDTAKASGIIDAVGSAPRMYGDDIISWDWQTKNNDEYKKWTEKNGFGIDDRHIHADRVKVLVREAFTAGIPQELIEEVLRPVSVMARNQAEGNYVTPDDVRDMESKLGSLLLDKVLRDKIGEGLSIESIQDIHYKCQQYEFSRTFSFTGEKQDTVVQSDRVKTTSYRALPGGDAIQTITSDHPMSQISIPRKQFENTLSKIRREIASEKARREKEAAKKRAEDEARVKLLEEKSAIKSDNETAFQEYYAFLGKEGGVDQRYGAWERIPSPEGQSPIILISKLEREVAISDNTPNTWIWDSPASYARMRVALFWGKGKTEQFSLDNLKNFKYSGWNKQTQEALKEALLYSTPSDALHRILGLSECHRRRDTHWFGRADTTTYIRNELETALKPHLESAADKKAFLRKTLDTLIEHGGIANGEVDEIVKKITQ